MGTGATCEAAHRASIVTFTRPPLVALWLAVAALVTPAHAAAEFSKSGVMVDPTFGGLSPRAPSREANLMPAPIEHPPSHAGSVLPELAPGIAITPNTLEMLDKFGSPARFRDDVGTRLHTGDALQDHARPDRFGATLTLPF